MKFFVIEDASNSPIDCVFTKEEAMKILDDSSYFGVLGFYSIAEIGCSVNKETVRALLSGQGGYAQYIHRVYYNSPIPVESKEPCVA